MDKDFWGEAMVFGYSRRQAIEDGVLVDISALFPAEVREAGIKYHVAMTAEAFSRCIGRTEDLPPGQDCKGRAWDVLWMFRCAAVRTDGPEMLFKLIVSGEEVDLRGQIGPGDDPEPVITLMMPDED